MDELERAKQRTEKRQTSSKKSTTSGSASNSGTKLTTPNFTDKSFEKTNLNVGLSNGITVDLSTGEITVEVPGLAIPKRESIPEQLHGGEFHTVADIKKPNIPQTKQATRAELETAVAEFELGINYEVLAQKANEYVLQQYKTICSKIKAYKQGILTQAEYEGLKQAIIDFAKAQEVTKEKGLLYGEQAHRTVTTGKSVVYSMAENEANLEKKRLKARKSFEEATQETKNFSAWLAGLKGNKETK